MTCSCKSRSSEIESANDPVNENMKEMFLSQISDFPVIDDSAKFIADLIRVYDLDLKDNIIGEKKEAISTYKKVKINGSLKDYIFIEYDYENGCTAAFPWKYQLLLSTSGKLIHTFNALRFEFISVFPNQNPFLVTLSATGKGNGIHQIYKMKTDELVNVLDENQAYYPQTYDVHEDNRVNDPNELAIQVNDFNQDGFNDISFKGKIVWIQEMGENEAFLDSEIINRKEVAHAVQNPFKTISVEYIFLYDQKSGHFKVKENYRKKYNLKD